MDGRPKSKAGFQVVDVVSTTEITFSSCIVAPGWDFFNILLNQA